MKKKIYVTRLIPEVGLNLLKDYDVEIFKECRPIEKKILLEKIEDIDALICLLSDNIDEEIINKAKNLKIIANYAVGYNNINIEKAKEKKIFVTNTPGVLTNATAEIAFALLISLTRRIIEADKFTREGKFIGWDPMLLLGDELLGKTIGIVGMGRIGQEMARKCKAFGMNIKYYQRKRLNIDLELELNAEYLEFNELLKISDVISFHTPLTNETYHLLNNENFPLLKDNVYIINTARGPIIDEKAMIKYIKNGKIKGVGLDVYEFEPEITKELFEFNNVILLPHIGSATVETRNKMSIMVAKNVISALEGGIPENLIPEMKELY